MRSPSAAAFDASAARGFSIDATYEMTSSAPPLDGITVLDFSHALAGPYCTMLMAAYGAKVIKVEGPEGDIGRTWGPPFNGEDAAYFVGLNSGKQSLAIDLKTPSGLDACQIGR